MAEKLFEPRKLRFRAHENAEHSNNPGGITKDANYQLVRLIGNKMGAVFYTLSSYYFNPSLVLNTNVLKNIFLFSGFQSCKCKIAKSQGFKLVTKPELQMGCKCN